MGDLISSLFISPEHLVGNTFDQLCQVIFLIAVYGFILLQASKMISGGSELLLLTPFAGVIGSIVLPVLGAVPDGAIVLFSGMGPDAKQQIHVGVGALAGSTIMLLTIPWFLSNLGGRVDLDEDGNGKYTQKPKLTSGHKCCGCMTTGSNPNPGVKAGGFLILITLVPYIVVQIGGFMNPKIGEGPPHDKIKWLVFSSLILCIALFVFYLVYQLKNQDDKVKEDKVEEVKMRAIQQGKISFSGAFSAEIKSIMSDSEH